MPRKTSSSKTRTQKNQTTPFWKRKPLEKMTQQEWESLCDGCGQCCLLKLEDEDTAEIFVTRLTCKLLDTKTCRCTNYRKRQSIVPDCLSITPDKARDLTWLPETCGYRRVAEGKDLEWWHPLISNDHNTVHEAGISVRGWARSEDRVDEDAIARYIIGAADTRETN